MSFLSLLSAFFGSLQTLLTAWRDRGLRQEGAAAKVAEIQKETLDEVKAANDAQAVVVRDVALHPERLRDDDGFRRPD